MIQPTKAVVGVGVLCLAAAGVLAWQVTKQFGGSSSVVSANTAVAKTDDHGPPRRGVPNMGEGTGLRVPGGAGDGEEFAWNSDNMTPEDMAAIDAQMTLNSGTPSDESMDFELFDTSVADVMLMEKAIEAKLTSGEWSEVAKAWRSFVQPLIDGDATAFAAAVGDLGGVSDGADGVYNNLSGYLMGAAVAWEASKIRRANVDGGPNMPALPNIPGMKLPEGAVPMMAMTNVTNDDQGNEKKTHSVNMPLTGLFPALREANDRTRYLEIWTPSRLKDSKGDKADLGLSVFMARVNNQWTPAGLRMGLRSDKANSRFSEAMSAARATRRQRTIQNDEDDGGEG